MHDLKTDLKQVATWVKGADRNRTLEQVRQCAAGILLLEMQERVRAGEAGEGVTWTMWYEGSKPKVTITQAARYMKLASTADEVTMESAKAIVARSQERTSCSNMSLRNDPVELIKKTISTKWDDGQRKILLLWMNDQYGGLANAI